MSTFGRGKNTVWINITKNHLIAKREGQELADVYKHDDIDSCLNNLKNYFDVNLIDLIEDHILFNYEHMGIKIDRNKPGEQMSLF
jgi:hypothetical protein